MLVCLEVGAQTRIHCMLLCTFDKLCCCGAVASCQKEQNALPAVVKHFFAVDFLSKLHPIQRNLTCSDFLNLCERVLINYV